MDDHPFEIGEPEVPKSSVTTGEDGPHPFWVKTEESARGERYKYWSFSRLDWYWLAPPPRLELFIEADPRALWIPDGSDWDGINDRPPFWN